MGQRPAKRPSILLATATGMITDASANLVTDGSRFRHSFEVPVDAVSSDPRQPRKHFEQADIIGLATTMAEQGQLQPILVRRDPDATERWIIVAGERRWRAARHNGWATLLAIEIGGDAEVVTILENLQRVDLSPIEEARGLQRLIDAKHWTQDRAAEVLGKTKSEISATLRILTLPEEVLTSELQLARNTLVELSRLAGPAREALLAQAAPGGLTVQAVRAAGKTAVARSAEPARARLDARRLKAATLAIEGAIEAGAVLDRATRDALQRLHGVVEALLRGPMA
jgi:ParB family chromosome partitioning protein